MSVTHHILLSVTADVRQEWWRLWQNGTDDPTILEIIMHYFLFVGTVVMAAVPCRKYGLVEWSKVGRKEGLPSVTEGGGGGS